MNLYSNDPSTGKPSVSLTILWISVVFLVTTGVLQILKKVDNSGLSLEFFALSASLYFGRRVNISKNNVLSETQTTDGDK